MADIKYPSLCLREKIGWGRFLVASFVRTRPGAKIEYCRRADGGVSFLSAAEIDQLPQNIRAEYFLRLCFGRNAWRCGVKTKGSFAGGPIRTESEEKNKVENTTLFLFEKSDALALCLEKSTTPCLLQRFYYGLHQAHIAFTGIVCFEVFHHGRDGFIFQRGDDGTDFFLRHHLRQEGFHNFQMRV